MTPIALTERYGGLYSEVRTRTVFVNPERIERYYEDDRGFVCIVFGRDHDGCTESITITEGLAEVARQLRYSRRAALIDSAEIMEASRG